MFALDTLTGTKCILLPRRNFPFVSNKVPQSSQLHSMECRSLHTQTSLPDQSARPGHLSPWLAGLMTQSLLTSLHAPPGISGITSADCIEVRVCSVVPERTPFPIHAGFSLRLSNGHHHPSRPAHTDTFPAVCEGCAG